jgi:hypothetical protein
LNEKLKEKLQKFENIYGNILESIHRTAKEALGYHEKRKNNKIWWTGEINQLLKEKRHYLKWLNSKSEEDEQNYIRKKNDSVTSRKDYDKDQSRRIYDNPL